MVFWTVLVPCAPHLHPQGSHPPRCDVQGYLPGETGILPHAELVDGKDVEQA